MVSEGLVCRLFNGMPGLLKVLDSLCGARLLRDCVGAVRLPHVRIRGQLLEDEQGCSFCGSKFCVRSKGDVHLRSDL